MNSSIRRLCLASLTLLVTACAKSDSDLRADSNANALIRPADSGISATAPLPASAKIAEISGFKTPESVRYDADQDVYFVANINGNPSQKDNNGFIARVSAESPTAMTMFIEGGRNGVTLHAPKGIAIIADTLWVADIDAVRAFNRRTGAPIRSVTPRGATFLNDVAAHPDGSVWVTDTGIRFDAQGAMTHPGTDQVFRISGTTATAVLSGNTLGGPNGLTWDRANSRWLLGGFSGKDLIRFTEDDHQTFVVASGPGGYDGLEVLADGRILITSWADSSVSVVDGNAMKKLIANVSAPADIGIDTKRMRLVLPRFENNTVEIWALR